MEYTFYDSHNDLGFGEDTEILVDLDYSCKAGSPPGWEDPGEDPECIINGWTVMFIGTANDEEINWSTLSPEKQTEVNDWVSDQANTGEVYDTCFQYESDYWEDYKADMADRRLDFDY